MSAWLARLLIRLGDWQRAGLSLFYAVVGPRIAYSISDFAARLILRLLPPLREQIQRECRLTFPALESAALRQLATRAFLHRLRNVADLLLARFRLHPRSFRSLGGALPESQLSAIHAARARRQPLIFVTAYYGPYDLLPVYLGLNGVPLLAVYKAHESAGFDRLRREVRAKSGCELVPLRHAAAAIERTLSAGGAIALVADHDDDPRGVEVEYLGRRARASRAVALLAQRFNAEVIVAVIRRTARPFHVELIRCDVMRPVDWAGVKNATESITIRMISALDRMIREQPAQYLWGHQRWSVGNADSANRASFADGRLPTDFTAPPPRESV